MKRMYALRAAWFGVLAAALVLAGRAPGATAYAADLYLLSACSLARRVGCEECAAVPVVGGLVLEPGPLAITRPHHLLGRLVVRGRSLTLEGTGLLIQYGPRFSLMVGGELNGASVTGSGSGWFRGNGQMVFHVRGLTLGSFVLDLDAAPVSTLALDRDRDGRLDGADACPGTACGALTDQEGCALEQLCPCAGPRGGGEWESPGRYVRCLSRATRELRQQGLLSAKERRRMLIRAAASGCGRSALVRGDQAFDLALLFSGSRAGGCCR